MSVSQLNIEWLVDIDAPESRVRIGSLVRRYGITDTALGTVIAIVGYVATVLWNEDEAQPIFPQPRRIHAPSFANQLVSVQPMPSPSGKIFYLNYDPSGSLGP